MPALQHSVEDLEVIYEKVRADSRFSLYHLRAVDAAIDVATDVRNDAQTTERAIKHFLARLDKSGGYEESIDPEEPLMHMAPVARVCHQMLRLRLGRGNG